jgi:hypothetical protein
MSGVDARGTSSASECERARQITRLTVLLAVGVFATSLYGNLPHALGLKWFYPYVPPFDGRDLSMLDHLGGEHRAIAEALSARRGFADPFHDRTGPTSWMAPVLPALQAALLLVGGINFASIAVAILQNLTLVFTGWIVLRAASRCELPHAPVIILLLFFATTWFYFSSCYQFTHDAWLVLLWVDVFVFVTERLWTSSLSRRSTGCWGLLGGLAMLSSPVLGPVWVALTGLLAFTSRRVRPFLVSVLVAAAVMTPWIARNAIVFGRLIPVKSNLPYEIYQSNVLEPDGLLREATGFVHPFQSAGKERARYRQIGEMAYLDEYRARSFDAIRRDPVGYLVRVKNRLLAATVFFYSYFPDVAGRRLSLRSLIYPLPFIGLVLVLMTLGPAPDRRVLIALLVYVTYLTPYVLVAYYRRYAMPLIGLQVMFEIWALNSIHLLWKRLPLHAIELKRLPMHLLIRDLASWEPHVDPIKGYTVIVACMRALAPLAAVNLRLATQKPSARMHEIILVFDCPVAEIPDLIHEAVRECSATARIRVLGYNARQHLIARMINWGWVYSWLSWSLAIASARTRAVIIHDLDSLPVHAGVFESLYDNWIEEGAEFCGISRYRGHGGVTDEMNLLRTYELVVDAPYLRNRFRPFDLFNKRSVVDGRLVDFDTVLHVQHLSPRRALRRVDETHLVHPSRVICDYTDFVSGRKTFKGEPHSFLILVYLLHLGGDSAMLSAIRPQLANPDAKTIRIFSKDLYIDAIAPDQWAWGEKQIRRLEQALFGHARPDVVEYLAGFINRAGDYRTVGREVGPSAVDDR